MKQVLKRFLRRYHDLACSLIKPHDAFEWVIFRPRSRSELGGEACAGVHDCKFARKPSRPRVITCAYFFVGNSP